MTEEITPFGGEGLTLKELKKEKLIKPVKKEIGQSKNDPKKLVIVLAVVIIFLVVIISLLIGLFVIKKPKTPTPLPSPVIIISSPIATSAAIPKSVNQRLDELEKNLNKVDLEQTEYAFPLLDFNLQITPSR